MKSFGSWEHDLGGLALYMGPGLHKPLDPNNRHILELGLKWYFQDESMLVFGVDKAIVESLRDQDFQRLLEYRFVDEDKGDYSALDDGTLVTTVSKQSAIDAMNR